MAQRVPKGAAERTPQGARVADVVVVSTVDGLAVVIEGSVDAELREVTARQQVSVLQAPTAERALRAILRLAPTITVVQVARADDEGVRLIRRLKAAGCAPVVAVATAPGEALERAVREAGATCYFPRGQLAAVGQILAAARGPAA